MEYEDAVRELKKMVVVDGASTNQLKAIVSSAVEMEDMLVRRDKTLAAKNSKISDLMNELEQAREAGDPPEVQPTPPAMQVPMRGLDDFSTPYDAFVAMHLVMEEGESVERVDVGDTFDIFREGSEAKGRITLYEHMREHYGIYTPDEVHMEGVRFKTYAERMRRYAGLDVVTHAAGQTRFLPQDRPMDTESIVQTVIAEWLSADLGTFHTAKGWLNIGRQMPNVLSMLSFRMQHIKDDSSDGRAKSVGRLLAPYVDRDVEFHVDGKAYEMCSRTESGSREYSLQPA